MDAVLLNADGSSCVEHIVWINLDRRPDRRAHMERLLAGCSVPHTRIPAIDGKQRSNAGTRSVSKGGKEFLARFVTNADDVHLHRPMNDAEVACTLSHLKAMHFLSLLVAYTDAGADAGADAGPERVFLVLEDDVTLTPSAAHFAPARAGGGNTYSPLANIVRNAPSSAWDILLLHHICARPLADEYTPLRQCVPGAPQIYSTAAFVVTRAFLRQVAALVSYDPQTDLFTFRRPLLSVADVFFFSPPFRAHAYRWNLFGASAPEFETNIGGKADDAAESWVAEVLARDESACAAFAAAQPGGLIAWPAPAATAKKKMLFFCHVGNAAIFRKMEPFIDAALGADYCPNAHFHAVFNVVDAIDADDKRYIAEKYGAPGKNWNCTTEIITGRNFGFDIGGFLLYLKKCMEENISYDYVVKIHTKTSDSCRKQMMEPIIGSVTRIKHVLDLLQNKPDVGMVGGQEIVCTDYQKSLVRNIRYICELGRLFALDNTKLSLEDPVRFVAGTMFWVRFSILRKYLSIENLDAVLARLNDEDSFDWNWYVFANQTIVPEVARIETAADAETHFAANRERLNLSGNLFHAIKHGTRTETLRDGMIEHAIERLFSLFVSDSKYKIASVAPLRCSTDVVLVACIDATLQKEDALRLASKMNVSFALMRPAELLPNFPIGGLTKEAVRAELYVQALRLVFAALSETEDDDARILVLDDVRADACSLLLSVRDILRRAPATFEALLLMRPDRRRRRMRARAGGPFYQVGGTGAVAETSAAAVVLTLGAVRKLLAATEGAEAIVKPENFVARHCSDAWAYSRANEEVLLAAGNDRDDDDDDDARRVSPRGPFSTR